MTGPRIEVLIPRSLSRSTVRTSTRVISLPVQWYAFLHFKLLLALNLLEAVLGVLVLVAHVAFAAE